MNRYTFLAVALPILSLSCGGGDDSSGNDLSGHVDDGSPPKVCDDGPISIEIEITPGLENDIEIVSTNSQKPGKNNRAEAAIEIRNTGAVQRRF